MRFLQDSKWKSGMFLPNVHIKIEKKLDKK